MQITLTATDGPHRGASFSFAEHDTFLVGRSKVTHFQLADKDMYFSRVHFLVELNPPHCRVTDMGSHNGTFVNGERVQIADLHDGDTIRAGHTLLTVSVQNDPPAKPPAPSVTSSESVQPVVPPEGRTFSSIQPGEALSRPGQPAAQARPALGSDGAVDLGGPPAADARPMPVIPGYRIVRELGQGAMGVVYLATPEAGGAPVAVKTILPAVAGTPKQVERFLREARILSKLDHPYIVGYRAMGEANGLLYFAMEYVEGIDARQLLKEKGPLPVRTAVRLVSQLLAALEYAHGKGFVHRDIKPANVLVARQPGGKQAVKLTDFGLARLYQASQLSGLTLKGDLGGTPAFLPPEQIMQFRDAQPASDQYSTAATLYNLLTDQFVYELPPGLGAQFAKILFEGPVPIRKRRPELPAELAAVVHRALAREPGKRYADVREFRRALVPFGR